jgi:hypothetical protein
MRRASLAAALAVALALGGPARAAFNEIIAGARPQGMGGAFVAVADDVNALSWNPAGITQLPSAEATFMHAKKFDLTVGPSLDLDLLAFVNWPMDLGTFGITGYREGSDQILTERVVSLSYARDLSPRASWGLNSKWLELHPTGAQVTGGDPAIRDQSTLSFDLGVLYSMTRFWKLGLVARNVGGRIGIVEIEDLRSTFRAGSAYRFEDLLFESDSLVWAVDIFTKEDIKDTPGTKVLAASGVEYTVDERVSFRAGVNRDKLTLGLGFGHPESGIFVDYAWADDEIGKTQRLSATYRFGAPPGTIHVVHHVKKPAEKERGRDDKDDEDEQPPRRESKSKKERPASRATGRISGDLGAPGRASRPRAAKVEPDVKSNEFEKELKDFINK